MAGESVEGLLVDDLRSVDDKPRLCAVYEHITAGNKASFLAVDSLAEPDDRAVTLVFAVNIDDRFI